MTAPLTLVASADEHVKHAGTDHPIHPLLQKRWSPRAFLPRAIDEPALLSLFEAARWAPSANNSQPWHFIVTRLGEAEHQRACRCLKPKNAGWAQAAPVLVVTSTLLGEAGGTDPYAWHDLGQAITALTLQATHLDLHVHQMAGFDKELARGLMAIEDSREPATVLVIGYLAAPEAIADEGLRDLETTPRTRKPLRSIVRDGS